MPGQRGVAGDVGDATGAASGVVLTIGAVPEHVRTARLVALAVARRTELGPEVHDEVRLAVGEACSRAVRLAATAGSSGPHRIEVRLVDSPLRLEVLVSHLVRAASVDPAVDPAADPVGPDVTDLGAGDPAADGALDPTAPDDPDHPVPADPAPDPALVRTVEPADDPAEDPVGRSSWADDDDEVSRRLLLGLATLAEVGEDVVRLVWVHERSPSGTT